MYGYLKRLLASTAAYQAPDIVAKGLALGTLPLYTRHLTPSDYGSAELLLTLVILASIVVRLGVVEAFLRFYFLDADPERRLRVARGATGLVFLTTTVAAGAAAIFAGPISRALLKPPDTTLMLFAILGLWTFTNLEMANAMLRVDERLRVYLRAGLINVALTVGLTVYLVVVRNEGARGLVLGNWAASGLVLLGLWWVQRDRLGLRRPTRADLPAMLAYGLPTVPAEASVFALNFVDRIYLYRSASTAQAGLYSLALKLAAVLILLVRAFQYSFPPLAYSIESDEEAARLYALVTTYYVLLCGVLVAGLTLFGRWVLHVFAAPRFFGAHAALPWVALGWALYGLFLVHVVLAGRARVTTRNFPAALAGLVANVVALVLLVPPLGIAGAGIALCLAYLVMLTLMHLLTRHLFPVDFEWGRLAAIVLLLGGVAVGGELLLADHGALGFLERAAALSAVPAVLVAGGFFSAPERARIAGLARAARARIARPG